MKLKVFERKKLSRCNTSGGFEKADEIATKKIKNSKQQVFRIIVLTSFNFVIIDYI